jgi:hypothetical protein
MLDLLHQVRAQHEIVRIGQTQRMKRAHVLSMSAFHAARAG